MFRFSPSRRTLVRAHLAYGWGVLALVLIASVTGAPGVLLRAQAAQLANLTDTLSTSKPGIGANHTIRFTSPSGIAANGSTLIITFPSGFDMSTIGEDDIDIATTTDLTTASSCGATQTAVATSSQTITIEFCAGGGGAIPAASAITVEIGTNATAFGTGAQQVLNHSGSGSYVLSIGGSMGDEGETRLIIVDAVVVSGAVETYLVFSITGVDAGQTVNADVVPTGGTTTATSMPFGTLSPTVPRVMAQDLAVTTNAVSGFMVSVEAAQDLLSTSGASINSFSDGSGTSTPITWRAPQGTPGLNDTFGHWGVTTEDVSLSDNNSFGDALYVGNFVGRPREIMYSTTSSDGITEHIGTTRVGYKAEITAMQEAARDYTTSLTYVVTTVF